MSDDPSLKKVERGFPSDLIEGKRIVEEILTHLKDLAWEEEHIFGVHLSIEEAIVNAIKHGNRLDLSKRVRVAYEVSNKHFWIQVTDEGPGFDPAAIPDCTEEENLDVPSGRGLMLMKCFMSHVEYNSKGNSVIMKKLRENTE